MRQTKNPIIKVALFIFNPFCGLCERLTDRPPSLFFFYSDFTKN
ncbi:hypothetical protein [Neisseria meningitidis serogroup B]|uniref:Uncharacterized protein n=1 Tax=Neisseria meningitidis serogroup B TaxID=491 RepID=A0A0H5QDM3_NEIMI|nr:hypothetical protein [Neisseria meningitidis serogroup B]CRZ00122.1 hypothetical protein [Neisseria meningitidis serogroup B]